MGQRTNRRNRPVKKGIDPCRKILSVVSFWKANKYRFD
jgi:hypothetical protein